VTAETSCCYVVQDYPANASRCRELVVAPLARLRAKLLVHGGTYAVDGADLTCDPARSYSYEENVLKFCDCVEFVARTAPDCNAYCFVEHDCWVKSPEALDAIVASVHDRFASAWGNLYDYPDLHWMLRLPYIKRDIYLVGATFILNRKGLQGLAGFVRAHRRTLSVWEKSCDFFLASYLQRDQVEIVSLNSSGIRCAYTGMYRRFDPGSRELVVAHKIDDYRAQVIELHRSAPSMKPAELSEAQHYLCDLPFDSSSSYACCGRRGKIYDGMELPIFFSHHVTTDRSIGFHAASHLFVRLRSASPYVLSLGLALNATAEQDVDFYCYIDGHKQFRETVARGELRSVTVPVPVGDSLVMLESEPSKYHQHGAHSILVNPCFVRVTRDEHISYELKRFHPLSSWRD
jgi:hypothetical protein